MVTVPLPASQNSITKNITDLQDGMYVYKAIFGNNGSVAGKLVIKK